MARILVVDDEPEVCNMIGTFLTRKGYKVFAAYDGEEALSLVKEERPHIVLLDIKMPMMDGIECLRRIKEVDKGVGVIMTTAVRDEEIGNKVMKLGAFDYITKPISLDYLQYCLMIKFIQMTA